MELGTGIFLSSLVIAIVLLYGITKDRWKWRRIAKGTGLTFLGLVALVAVVGTGAYLFDRPKPLTRQTHYAGLRLGMSQEEVLYVKGYPPIVYGEDAPSAPWKGYLVIDASKLETGQSARDYQRWSYPEGKRRLDVTFNPERTAVAAIQCYSEDKLSRCPSVAGVEDGDSEATTMRKLGNAAEVNINGVTKLLTYRDLGVQLHLTKESVYMLTVSSPDYKR